jgi:peptide deformylase
MIYPIVAIGDAVLKKKAADIEKGSSDVVQIAEDMFETMYHARGVGLAAPQVGLSIRMFVIDSTAFEDEEEQGVKKVFINPVVEEEWGDEWAYEEGCLSIPGVRADVFRPENVRIRYFDTDWKEHVEEFDALTARVIQHEYDHIQGILFPKRVLEQSNKLYKSRKDKKGEVVFDEIKL